MHHTCLFVPLILLRCSFWKFRLHFCTFKISYIVYSYLFLYAFSFTFRFGLICCLIERRIKNIMSLHRSHSDVEEGEVFSVSPISDVQDTSHIELMENPSYNNSRPSSPAMIAIPPKKSTFKKKFHGKWWNRIRSLFLGWWARMRSLFLVWWARAVNLFVDWWMGELLAILLSIIAFFAIIYALRKHDGHNLSMLPHHISLNFVISILATVSKTSLLFAVASALGQFKWLWMFSKQRSLQDLQVFDDASRGPLGASRLLASRRSL